MVEYVTRILIPADRPDKDRGMLEYQLPNIGGLTQLELILKATNGGSGNVGNGILNAITRVRIQSNYNRFVFDLSGTEAYKLATLRDRDAPAILESDVGGVVQYVKIPILLGRTRDDQLYGLDLITCDDPKLVIEFDLTKIRACGATGFVSGSFEVTINGTITRHRERPAYIGVIGGWEIILPRPTRAQRGRTKIHTQGRCIGLYLYAYKSSVADGDLVRNVKLAAPTEESTIVDKSFVDLQQDRRLISGSVVTSWAPIWVDQNRLTNQLPKPLDGDKAYLELEELVADGVVALIGEFVGRQ